MKFFSINKGQFATIVTLVVVLALGAGYFFIYVPANERDVQQQRFRTLQNIDKNIHTKIDNSLAMVNLLIKAYHDAGGAKKEISHYIANYSPEKFKLSQPVVLPRTILNNRDSIDLYRIQVNNATSQISLLSQKMIIAPNADSSVYQMSIGYNIEQFLKMLLPANVFDEYIVFSRGVPIYQTFPSGISSIVGDSVLKISEGIAGSVIRDYNISGTNYKMFLQPVNFGDHEWIIGGLLKETRYNREKTQLPAQVILLLVTVVLVFLLSFPWIKLYQMGSKDRLTIRDAVSTVVISMLLMSLLFFTFFKYNVPFRTLQASKEKKMLAGSIIQSFNKEIDTAYSTLVALDNIVADDGVDFDIANLGKAVYPKYDSATLARLVKINDTINNFPVKQVYWLGPSGDEVINWNTDTVNGPHGNFKERPYFVTIQSGRPYLLHETPENPYYLDQLVSRTSGVFTTVISIPSRYRGRDNDTGRFVAGMSFTVKSLQQAILPTGFQFALIDNSGKVLYHSEVSKSLNENLLEEFSDNKALISCIEARAEGYFKTGYYSSDYYVYTTPVKGLPYFLVILEDAGAKATRDMEVYSFAFSCMLLFFGFMFVQILVTFIVSSKRSFFKKQIYNTSWIGPRKSAHRQYNLAILVHACIIILLIIFFQFSSFLLYVFLLLFSVTFLSLFLNGVFARKYRTYKPNNYKYKVWSMRWLLACIVIIDLAAGFILQPGNTLLLLLFEVISFAIGIPLYLKGDIVLNEIRLNSTLTSQNKWNYVQSFTMMAFTRLIVSSGIPVMFFYTSGYNYEQNLDIRYKQLQFAQKVVQKLPPAALDSIHRGLDYQSGVYFDSTWIKNADTINVAAAADSIRYYSPEDRRALILLNLFRLHLTDEAIRDDKFYASHAIDLSFFHNHLLKQACDSTCSTTTAVQTKRPGQYLKVSSANLNYHFPKLFCSDEYCKGLLYWLLLIGVLVLFYIILLNIIKKIFALNLPDMTRWSAMDEEILTGRTLNNLVFVIGLPGSGKLTRVLEKINTQVIVDAKGDAYQYEKNNDAASNVFVADLMNIPDSGNKSSEDEAWQQYALKIFDPKNRLVIINHFEYNIQDSLTTRIKLNLLERIMVQNSCRVIILSTIHPVAFLESTFDQSFRANLPPVPGQDLERWHVLLGHFRIVVFPLELSSYEGIRSRFEQLIASETRTTHFLNKMQEAAIKVATNIKESSGIDRESDELAFKLQMTSHYFYMYIWQSLTKEEKFLLYDHAEDNLVNSFDDYNLNMLICKGILVRADGALKIFNKGFRNFILTAIGNLEAMKIKNQIKDNGNWNKLKNPMIIIILAILVFLVASQQEAYTKLITYAAALATGIPAIMKLFSLFDGTREKGS